jgi:hypothetical protein
VLILGRESTLENTTNKHLPTVKLSSQVQKSIVTVLKQEIEKNLKTFNEMIKSDKKPKADNNGTDNNGTDSYAH